MKTGFQIRTQADDFLKAYQVLKDNYNSATLAVMTPSVVCLAFAVELYLKHLHFVITGEAPWGHNICKLFEMLPERAKQEVFAHKSINENPFMTRGNILSTQFFSPSYNAYDRFIDQMKRISDGFEKWRYSYESVNLQYDSYFALGLIDAVASTADGMQQNIKTEE